MLRSQVPVTAPALILCALATALAGLACNVASTGAPAVLATQPPPREQPADAGAEQAEADSEESAGESQPYSGEFLGADCSCAGYEPTKELPWGNASLSCRYEWSGPNIDGNALGFEVSHYYHEDRLLPDFQQDVEDLSGSYENLSRSEEQVEELRNDAEGYVFLSYGPGGIGKQGDIPLCGNGRGVFMAAGEFLITTELFSCDLPYSKQAYRNALADMETCARRAIERIQ